MTDTETIVLGFDIGGTRVRAALVQGAHLLFSQAVTWPAAGSPEDDVRFIADLARQVLAQAAVAPGVITRAGVALAALTDLSGTVVQWPNRPSWAGLPFGTLLATQLNMAVAVGDDANAATLAEWRYGNGQGARQMLLIMAGTGIGAGLILDQRLFLGRNGWAGELGHTIVDPHGVTCPCGRRGCLQALAAGRRLEQIAAAHSLSSVAELLAAARQGVAWAQSALADSGRWVGLAAANMANVLDLEVVVIGGGLTVLGADWWEPLEAAFQANVLNQSYRSVALRPARLPETAGLLGAALFAREGTAGSMVAPVGDHNAA